MPQGYKEILLGERFGIWPGDIRRKPQDEVWYYEAILGIEAERMNLYQGMAEDEELFEEDADLDA